MWAFLTPQAMSEISSAIGAGIARGRWTAADDASQKLYQPHSRIDNPLQTFP
jgi:hypothetical protein